MYKKSANLIHLHERTGSHATKGTGRGTVWWKTHDPENFSPEQFEVERRLKMKTLKRQLGVGMKEFQLLLAMQRDAVDRRDTAMLRALRPSIRAFSKNLTKITKEIAAAKRQRQTIDESESR